MVGRQVLALLIEVQILVPEPRFKNKLKGLFLLHRVCYNGSIIK